MRAAIFLVAAGMLAGTALAEDAPPTSEEPAVEVPDVVTEPEFPALLAAARSAAVTQPIGGLTYRVFEMPDLGLKVHAWAFEQTRFRMTVAKQKTPKGSPVADMIGDGVFAINGGFFERDDDGMLSPSGLVIVDGKTTAPEHDRAGSGIVYADERGVGLGYRKQLTSRSAMHDAVQIGPILVDPGGKISVSSKQHDRQKRGAICLRPGTFTAVAVEGGLSLFQFASLLAEPEASGGFGCDSAINLDGGPSTQVLFRSPDQAVEITGWPVVNALVVTRIAEPAKP